MDCYCTQTVLFFKYTVQISGTITPGRNTDHPMLIITPTTRTWLPSATSPTRAETKAIAFPIRTPNTIIHAQTNHSDNQPSAGHIKRNVLEKEGRTKLNPYPDREFYAYPRFVTHVDDRFISTLTDLYRARLKPGWDILDLMSSWVSHLPAEVEYKTVVGLGLNAAELARNPRLDYFIVKDLNQEADQALKFQSCSFDAVLCTVSVQYLQHPEKVSLHHSILLHATKFCFLTKVFAEVFRVLKPRGVFIVSFSNRMFYEKAISAWRDGTAYSRVRLVVQYFQCVHGFTQPEIIRKLPATSKDNGLPFTVIGNWIANFSALFSGSDPFYAVISYKNFKAVYE